MGVPPFYLSLKGSAPGETDPRHTRANFGLDPSAGDPLADAVAHFGGTLEERLVVPDADHNRNHPVPLDS